MFDAFEDKLNKDALAIHRRMPDVPLDEIRGILLARARFDGENVRKKRIRTKEKETDVTYL